MGRNASAFGGAAVLVLAGAVPAAVPAQQSAPHRAALVFDGVTVIDVEQGKPIPDQRVVIVDKHIQALGSPSSVAIPKDAEVVPAKDKYLIPGLWDLHVHTNGDATYPLFIANGVTGFRDAWASVRIDTMIQWQREILAGTRVGPPRQLLSGVAINEGDDSCTRDDNGLTGHVCVSNDTADIGKLVRALKAAGASFVKTYDLGPEAYFRVVAAARREGLRVGGHAASISPFDAADSGVSIFDHVGPEHVGDLDSYCFNAEEATVEACRKVAERWQRSNTWATVTLSNRSIRFFADASDKVIPKLLTKTVDEFWTNFTYNPTWLHGRVPLPPPDSVAFGYLKIPMQVGLPILSGGDTFRDAGFKTHADMAILVDRGLTPLAALQAATLNPAKMLRATDSLGTVAAGKLADLVLLDANPLDDIANSTMIRAVVANGRYFDRAALDALLAEMKTKGK